MEEWRRHMHRVPRLVRAHIRRRLSYWGRYIVADIRKHSNVFKYQNASRSSGPRLINSMWTRRGKSREPIQQIGWSVPWGEVLEFGPRRKKSWIIAPRGFRSDKAIYTSSRSGGQSGVALRFLRFQYKGKIVYARRVKHIDKPSHRRPHVEPALKRHERDFAQDILSIPQRVIEGSLR